jgi:hypothetical protein
MLMDDIYTTLAKMTFIPASAIKRGPHQINTTVIQCSLHPDVLRLMELLPYVDKMEVHEEGETYRTDWLYGGEFLDYRNPDDLYYACRPLHEYDGWAPEIVALTSWGRGGWNGDRTHVLMYDTEIDAISVFEGEEDLRIWDQDSPPGYDYYDHTGIGLFNHSIERPLLQEEIEWKHWFVATTFLQRILDGYQSLAWTPWQTSNREDGWGIDTNIIKDLLRNNGWPDSFDPDKFNADFIRAKMAAKTKRGAAETVYKTIEELAGPPDEPSLGNIESTRKFIENLDLQTTRVDHDEQEHWYSVFRAQSQRWLLARQEQGLVTARQEYTRLCPNDECVKPSDEILWEFHAVEKEFHKMQRSTSPERTCKLDLADFQDFAPASPRYENCVARRRTERYWLCLAYAQSKIDAETHCADTGCTLRPQPTLEEIVNEHIDKLEAGIKREQARAIEMYEWLPALPEHAEKARSAFEMESSAVANGPWYVRDRIEWLREMLEGGEEGKKKLWIWAEEREDEL